VENSDIIPPANNPNLQSLGVGFLTNSFQDFRETRSSQTTFVFCEFHNITISRFSCLAKFTVFPKVAKIAKFIRNKVFFAIFVVILALKE
jgi:hypothetical protein